jgi:hypothetical protein
MHDLRDHTFAPECWCSPDQTPDIDQWEHHSMDRREHTIEAGVTQ